MTSNGPGEEESVWNNDSTRSSLLYEVRNPENHIAIRKFFERYAPTIYMWCLRRGAQPADAEDITQNVLVLMLQKLSGFDYNRNTGRFRSWLKTITHNAWADWYKKQQKAGTLQAESTWAHTLKDSDSLAEALEHIFELEVLEKGIELAKCTLSEKTWMVYHSRVFRNLTAREVSEETGIAVGTVHVMKSRFERELKAAIQSLNVM